MTLHQSFIWLKTLKNSSEAADNSALYRVAAQNEGLRVLADSPNTHDQWAIATGKGDMALRARLNEALAMAEADGSLPALRVKWSMPAP